MVRKIDSFLWYFRLIFIVGLWVGSTVFPAPAQQVIDICEAIDTSRSMSDDELALEVQGFKAALNDVLLPAASAGSTIRLAIVGFSSTVQVFLPLTPVTSANRTTIEAALDAVQNTTDRGLTNLGGAINQCTALLSPSTVPRKVIDLSTDGRPTTGPSATDAAEGAKNAGIELWTLGVTPDADNALLSQLAGCPASTPNCGARNFSVATFSDFAQAVREKLESIAGGDQQPPIAVADSASTPPGLPVVISVRNNDSDPNGDPLTITSVTQPANGTAVINPDGTVTYTPNSGFVGTDTFTYTISDGRGGVATASVTVFVGVGPPGPIGIPDLSPIGIMLLSALFFLLLIRELRRRSSSLTA